MKVSVDPAFLTKILIEKYANEYVASGEIASGFVEKDKAAKGFAKALKRFLGRQTDEDLKN